MEIIATARLRYWDGESIIGGRERLELVVKFKEEGKFIKTKLIETLASTYDVYYPNNLSVKYEYEDYLNHCELLLGDIEFITEKVEEMIKEYFNSIQINSSNYNRTKDIQSKVHKLGKIEIKVKVN